MGFRSSYRLRLQFSAVAAEANRRLAAEYAERMGVPAELLLSRTRPHTLVTFLRTPIPLSFFGGAAMCAAFIWLGLPFYLAPAAAYLFVTTLAYLLLRLAGDRGMAMGARAVTYQEAAWSSPEEAVRRLAPYLYHGWTHLAGRRGLVRLHNSLAVATAYLREREQGGVYQVYHFPDLARSVEAGYQIGGWGDLERDVLNETKGLVGWVREWTKYQYLGHSRKAYVLGGLIAGRAIRLAEATESDPWMYLKGIAHGQSMAAAEQHYGLSLS